MPAEDRLPAPVSRRALIASAVAAIPVPALASIPPQWRELIRSVSFVHENGLAAAMHAYAHQDVLHPSRLDGVQLQGHHPGGLPALSFRGMEAGIWYTATPDGVWEGRPVPYALGPRVL